MQGGSGIREKKDYIEVEIILALKLTDNNPKIVHIIPTVSQLHNTYQEPPSPIPSKTHNSLINFHSLFSQTYHSP